MLDRYEHEFVVTLLARTAEAWTTGNLLEAEEWCRRAWHATRDREYVDAEESGQERARGDRRAP
jgi:hypothetical protein